MLSQHTIASSCGHYTRHVWLVTPTMEMARQLCVFLDAELYLQGMECLPIVEELLTNKVIPPTTFVFVSHGEPANRHSDFICTDTYSRFIAADVVAWAKERHAHLADSGHAICGASLSGLAAAHAALWHPSVKLGSQSKPRRHEDPS